MSISKQSSIGAVLLLVGGAILAFAMTQQSESPNVTLPDTTLVQHSEHQLIEHELTVNDLAVDDNELPDDDNVTNSTSNMSSLTPVKSNDSSTDTLTTDMVTETNILNKKQKQRAAQVKAQEAEALDFLKEKETAAQEALVKARKENEAFSAKKSGAISRPNVEIRVEEPIKESTPSPKSTNIQASTALNKTVVNNSSSRSSRPESYRVAKGEGLMKIANSFGTPVKALAEANNMKTSDKLVYGETLNIHSKAQEANLLKKSQIRDRELKAKHQAKLKSEEIKKAKAEARNIAKQKAKTAKRQKLAAEKKRKEEEQALKSTSAKRVANKNLAKARVQVRKEDAKGTFGVQVALASDQNKADKIAKTFRAAGYKVKTSQTSRGVRVMVGPERGKIAALALKDKINSDPKVKVRDAWVLYWR